MTTQAEFMAYEQVRKRGRYNMFDPNAQLATGLSRETYLDIIKNYGVYTEKWLV